MIDDREPTVTGREGRTPVEISVAIHRSQRDRRPVKFRHDAKIVAERFGGRLAI
jgi:hypothetical protein